jgi:2-polyprenyl-6-methoxyphenol hydroxylase-like FAD-dependent oxidoreductase
MIRVTGRSTILCSTEVPPVNGAGRKPRILIVGAGIAGLTLAASLERFGFTPTVVEIGSASLSRGLALLLTGNVGLALRRVALEQPVIEQGIVLERILQIDPLGATVDDLDLRPSGNRYAASVGITRDGLVSALSSAARAKIHYSTTITSVDWSTAAPEVVFSDGTHDRFDLVVGADGIGSAVRKMIYPDVQPVYRSFCAWRTVMECSEPDAVFRLSTTTGCFLGSFPVAPDLVYAFLLASSADIRVLPADQGLAHFKDLAAGFRGNVSPLIQQQHDPSRVIFVPVQEVTMPSYRRGRVLLIGDAAHAFPPLLAQGAAMAIEDAVALAELLSGSANIDQVLRAYESRRRPRVEAIRAAVRHRGIARGMEGPVTPELLELHPPTFSTSLKAYEELIEDPLAPGRAAM